MAEDLPEATVEALRALARSVALHRRRGGTLDALPAEQRGLLQALDGPRLRFFMAELAEADAGAGRDRFRAALGRWRPRAAGDAGRDPGEAP
jgi:hypothetical protein